VTPLLTASASPTIPTGTVVLLLALAAAGYLLACLIWPYTTCTACGGTTRHHSPTGTAWRTCTRCGGRGARRRLGARLFGSHR
jgi:DnaJ-class molecular chaperone